MKNNNPVFSQIQVGTSHYQDVDAATYKGITFKTGFFLLISIIIAFLTAAYLPEILNNNPTGLYVALGISSIVGFISVIVGRVSPRKAKYAGTIYAACQGLFLGTLTAIAETIVPGVGFIAAFSTLIIFGVMLILYATGVLRAGSFFRKLAYAMSFGAIAIILFVGIFSIFSDAIINNLPLMIGIEAFLLIYGAITLIFNFDEASYVVNSGCTKDSEWTVSLGLLVSIIYIYIEVVRLIILIAANNDN